MVFVIYLKLRQVSGQQRNIFRQNYPKRTITYAGREVILSSTNDDYYLFVSV